MRYSDSVTKSSFLTRSPRLRVSKLPLESEKQILRYLQKEYKLNRGCQGYTKVSKQSLKDVYDIQNVRRIVKCTQLTGSECQSVKWYNAWSGSCLGVKGHRSEVHTYVAFLSKLCRLPFRLLYADAFVFKSESI